MTTVEIDHLSIGATVFVSDSIEVEECPTCGQASEFESQCQPGVLAHLQVTVIITADGVTQLHKKYTVKPPGGRNIIIADEIYATREEAEQAWEKNHG